MGWTIVLLVFQIYFIKWPQNLLPNWIMSCLDTQIFFFNLTHLTTNFFLDLYNILFDFPGSSLYLYTSWSGYRGDDFERSISTLGSFKCVSQDATLGPCRPCRLRRCRIFVGVDGRFWRWWEVPIKLIIFKKAYYLSQFRYLYINIISIYIVNLCIYSYIQYLYLCSVCIQYTFFVHDYS